MVMLYQILRQAARAIRDETWADRAPPTLSIRMALIVVTAFPVVVAYPFFQKYFVKGVLIGSIKG
jgi:putative aldouronate transport system permease protein